MKKTSGKPQIFQSDSRSRFKLLAWAMALGVLIALMALSVIMAVVEAGFNHLSCKMNDDTLGSALSHARSLVDKLQKNAAFLGTSDKGESYMNASALRDYLIEQEQMEPQVLYAMIASRSGRVFVHTAGETDGLHIWGSGSAGIPSQGSFAEFPGGRFGFKEPVYEIRAPFSVAPWQDFILVIGLSKARISKHIADVRSGMIMWMLAAAGIGIACLAVPIAGLWFVIHRYRIIATRARQLAQLAQLGELSKGLAHEIRNPLNAVRFNLKILEEESDRFPEDLRDGYRQLVRRVTGEIERVDEMLTKYLNYVRPSPCATSSHDLNAIAQETIELVMPECKRSGIDILSEFSPNLPPLMLDEKQMRQVLLNVLVNAQQILAPRGGKIVVRTCLDEKMAILAIEDSGPGVPPTEREKIFEPFFSKREGGTGLGLPIARRIMEGHGGSIECSCKASMPGTVFTMKFPLPSKASKERRQA